MADIRINYEVDDSEVKSANDALQDLNSTTDEATGKTDDFNEASAGLNDQLKNVANNFTIAGKGLGDLGAGLSTAAKGEAAAAKGANTLSFALKAIPIVALIAGFASLVAFFTKTERGAQKLRVLTASLSAGFAALTDKVVIFGEALFTSIEEPSTAFEDFKKGFIDLFVEFIPNAIGKVVDGFGLLGDALGTLIKGDFEEASAIAEEGFRKLNDGLLDLNPVTAVLRQVAEAAHELGEEVKADVAAAAALEAQLNKVVVAERELSVARAQANADIEKQKLIAEDVTKTFEEREAAAVSAFELENNLLTQEIALQRERVRIIQAQNALSESNEEDLQAEADALIRLAEIEQASGTKQIELNNKINAIRAERLRAIDAETKAVEALAEVERVAAEDKAKREEEARKKREEEELELQRKIQEAEQETFDRRIAIIDSVANTLDIFSSNRITKLRQEKRKELAVEGQTAEQKKKIEEDFNALILEEQRSAAKRNKALALFDIGINTAEAITKALPNVPLSIIVGALGAAQAVAVASAPLPAFKDGVINLQGGVRGKDSIPSILMPGESVMTTRETSDFLPTFNAIRRGQVDPDVLNSLALGQVDNTKVIKVPGTEFHLNENGFAAHIRTANGRVIKKQKRYSSNLFK